jgi:ABC-type transporter Mla subunit MlaD
MKLKLVTLIVAAALPFCAQAQQPSSAPKATNADAQRVVKMISGDKVKAQAYCDMNSIGDQIEQAQQKHDDKKADELAAKADTLAEKLGPEWDALMNGLQSVDENSKDGQAIGATLETLNKLCAK